MKSGIFAADLGNAHMKSNVKRFEAYENEIKVGDVVETMDIKGIVTELKKLEICVVCSDGSSGYWLKNEVTKTGKHIDIQKILDELKEGTE